MKHRQRQLLSCWIEGGGGRGRTVAAVVKSPSDLYNRLGLQYVFLTTQHMPPMDPQREFDGGRFGFTRLLQVRSARDRGLFGMPVNCLITTMANSSLLCLIHGLLRLCSPKDSKTL